MLTTFAQCVYVDYFVAHAQLHKVRSMSYLSSVADELSKATYGAPNKPGMAQETPNCSLIIYIIHISRSLYPCTCYLPLPKSSFLSD